MKDTFDELAKNMAQPVTRKQALKKFGIGLAGLVLTCLGLANRANADPRPKRRCHTSLDCGYPDSGLVCCHSYPLKHGYCAVPEACF
jgi:hypothetical protein